MKKVKCELCGGTGLVDTGDIDEDGEPILVACDCPEGQRAEEHYFEAVLWPSDIDTLEERDEPPREEDYYDWEKDYDW